MEIAIAKLPSTNSTTRSATYSDVMLPAGIFGDIAKIVSTKKLI